MFFFQRTLRKSVTVKGVGIHSGKKCKLVLKPSATDTGLYFTRKDLKGSPQFSLKASETSQTTLATTLAGAEMEIMTVEHCLSALSAMGVDNAHLELYGPELPIGDGSAKIFYDAIVKAGVAEQDQPRRYVCVLDEIFVGDSTRFAKVVPHNGLHIHCTIDFNHPCIGQQSLDLDINPVTFQKELSEARTFGLVKDLEKAKALGRSLGASLENAIGLSETEVLNPEGLRSSDEFVRHKLMDAIGDLATLGYPLMGYITLRCAGHSLLNELVMQILKSKEKYKFIELGGELAL